MQKIYKLPTVSWCLERIIFLLAGLFSLTGLILGFFVQPYFYGLTALVSVMQIIFALTGFCPMAIFLSWCGKKSCY